MCKIITPDFKDLANNVTDKVELEELFEQVYLEGYNAGYLDNTQRDCETACE